jgi:hypothetical protein
VNRGALEATLAGLRRGTTVLLESSTDVRDWFPIQSNVVNGFTFPISRPIDRSSRSEFFRASRKMMLVFR